MKRFGLIGHPIAHSLSPALFKAGYDGRYPYELIETADFEEAYQRFLDSYDGINVTAPFKEAAFAKADIISEECRLIGATNLLVKTPEGIKAYNSDYLGVRLWLSAAGMGPKRTPPTSWVPPPAARGVARFSAPCPQLKGATALIVGLGGAGKAAAVAAASLGMKIVLMNRTAEKAEKMADTLRNIGCETEARAVGEFRKWFREADIIIYNIPGAIQALGELETEDFNPGHRKSILEANYKDPSFAGTLLERMKEANPEAEYTGGKTWLLYQALTGYEIFTGENPDLERMSDVL